MIQLTRKGRGIRRLERGLLKRARFRRKPPPLEQTRVSKATRSQQRKGGEVSEVAHERRPRVLNWNPPLVLDGAPLTSDSFIRDFDNGWVGYVANFVE